LKRAKRFDTEKQEKITRSEVTVKAKTENQRSYLRSLNDMSIDTLGVGYAGTGKTFLAVNIALQKYLKGDVEKIILIRPAVSLSKTIGLLPGDVNEKMLFWLKPFTNIIEPILGKSKMENDIKAGKIEIIPLEFIQGITFNHSYVIIDEAENCSMKEIYLLLTRRGYNSKIVFSGDTRQTALQNCGLAQLLQHKACEYMDVVDFGLEDVVRSELCKQYLQAFHT
jgi:phosphate starvation-inducible protein PhoH and related proteins